MGFTVRVQDFQSIRDAEIHIEGFTTLTGTNNTGKSAMVRAIRAVFTNPGGHSFVRYGADQTTVTITFDDGNTVVWEKGPKVNRYTVNGKQYDKVGRGYPGIPDAVKDLGIVPIEVSNQTLWPQIAPQISGQTFLVDGSGAVLAEAVADPLRVGTLSDALRSSEKDRKAVTARLKIRREDEAQCKTDLAAYEGLDSVVSSVSDIEEKIEKVNKIRRALDHLTQLRERWVAAKRVVERLSGIDTVSVPSDALISSTSKTLSDLEWAQHTHAEYTRYKQQVESLAGVEKVKIPLKSDLDSVRGLLEEHQALRHLQSGLAQARASVKRYEGAEDLSVGVDTARAEKVFKGLEITLNLQQRMRSASDGVANHEAALADAKKDLVAHEEAVKQVLGALRECPTCGSVQEGHDHAVG